MPEFRRGAEAITEAQLETARKVAMSSIPRTRKKQNPTSFEERVSKSSYDHLVGVARKRGIQHRIEKQVIRSDIAKATRARQTEDVRGTFATGLQKMSSEEARLTPCHECGSSAGRHMRVCSQYQASVAA